MEEYINKIKQTFSRYLRNYFAENREIVVRGMTIDVIRLLHCDPDIFLNNVRLHELLSGDETIIDIRGTFQITQRVTNGSRNRFIEFWANNTSVRFNKNNADFEIIEVPDLLYIDFNN
jgi:hypothetical protein